jgi:hypothetical protein
VKPLFATSQPVSEEQLSERLRADGYSDISIEKQGYYLKAITTKDVRRELVAVDSRDGAPANHWVEDED